jgi:hypothetical protein
MATRCAVFCIAAALAGLVASTSAATEARTDAPAAGRCGKWAVAARVGGKPVCLRDDGRCSARHAARYRRYGFDCSFGRLLTRWDYLTKRPLTVPQIAPGQPCPVTTVTGRVGGHSGLGPGPAYPLGTHNVVTMRMPPPESWGTEWNGTKRVWLLDTRLAARALVRGRQLDGSNEVRFVRGPQWTEPKLLNPVPTLQVEGDTPSLTRLRDPGCYAYQVDVRTSSYLIVFEARAG